jgi:hypothetical protein
MALKASIRLLFGFFVIAALAVGTAVASEDNRKHETVALGVEGINAEAGEDNPGILYILPWQPPTMPRRTRGALEPNAPELLEPVDPDVFARHQNFQQSLNPALDSSNSPR